MAKVLVKRPVDFAFDAMPPLADRIGSPVARFLNLFSSLQQDSKYHLGKQIFETYPARSLNLLGLPSQGYKKTKLYFKNKQWRSEKSDDALVKIAKGINLTAKEEVSLNDDELDAVICAITGVVDENHRLQGDELAEYINRLISNGERYRAPKGYVLLNKKPETKINITRMILKSPEEILQAVVC